MFFLLGILWFIRTSKVILFYLYLWQIKEYHIGRFLDHFRTEKGKRLILNKVNLAKLGLLFVFLFYLLTKRYLAIEWFLGWFLGILIFLYLVELFFALKNIFQRKLKRPVITKKTIFLISVALLIEIIVLFILATKIQNIFYFALGLLIFDIFAPKIASLVVLSLQPITVLLRYQIIKKAKIKRQKFKKLIVIGITGSYGKTTTKEFLSTILSEKFNVLKTQEHQNSEMGISQCILKELKSEHQVFVVEMGAYRKGGIKLLCDIVKPKIGVVAGVNKQHLALFKSMENLLSAEGGKELVDSLPQDGTLILNGDDEIMKSYNYNFKNTKCYSAKEKMDLWAEDIKVEIKCLLFKVFSKDGDSDFKVNVLGGHNIFNILAAALVAKESGMKLEEISKACQKIKPGEAAIKLIRGKEDINILDASYSANPDGVIADLDYLNIYPGKKAIVMPCLIELGSASKKIHKRIGRKISEVCDLAILTTKERSKDIKEGAIETGMKKENVIFIENPQQIFTRISIFCGRGDTVLFEGRIPKEVIEKLRVAKWPKD